MLTESATAEAEQGARSQVLQLVLPWPPSANTYWRSIVRPGWKHASVIISERGREYRHEVGILCTTVAIQKWARDNAKKPVSMHVACYPPDKRIRDLMNLDKSLADSLQNCHVLDDDYDLWDVRYTRACLSQPPGRVVVRLQPFDLSAAP